MCASLSIAPDVDALHEWSVWITPIIEPRRFYTHFYVAALPSCFPVRRFNKSEAVSAEWLLPADGTSASRIVVLTDAPR